MTLQNSVFLVVLKLKSISSHIVSYLTFFQWKYTNVSKIQKHLLSNGSVSDNRQCDITSFSHIKTALKTTVRCRNWPHTASTEASKQDICIVWICIFGAQLVLCIFGSCSIDEYYTVKQITRHPLNFAKRKWKYGFAIDPNPKGQLLKWDSQLPLIFRTKFDQMMCKPIICQKNLWSFPPGQAKFDRFIFMKNL